MREDWPRIFITPLVYEAVGEGEEVGPNGIKMLERALIRRKSLSLLTPENIEIKPSQTTPPIEPRPRQSDNVGGKSGIVKA